MRYRVVAKRVTTLLLGLVFVSLIAKIFVLYTNPSFRLYAVGYLYDYSRLNYLQFFILFIIPAISAVFLYRADFKIINNFYDRIAGLVKKAFYAGIENHEKILIVTIAVFWIFNLMEVAFLRNLIESKKRRLKDVAFSVYICLNCVAKTYAGTGISSNTSRTFAASMVKSNGFWRIHMTSGCEVPRQSTVKVSQAVICRGASTRGRGFAMRKQYGEL